jgi:1-acyl-sn-glycerol-3-phosphate acyltransferase
MSLGSYRDWQRWLGWLYDGYWPTCVEGQQFVPSQGPTILCGNHPTVVDGLLLALHAPRRVSFMVRADVMAIPLLGTFLRRMGYITVRRGGTALQTRLEALAQGACVGIFAEADPTFSLQLQEFRRGVAVLAQRSGAPVLPFALRGTEKCCGERARSAGAGPVDLAFGEPIWPKPEESVEELRDRVQAAVQTLLDRPYKPSTRPGPGARYLFLSCLVRPLSWALLQLGARARRRLD